MMKRKSLMMPLTPKLERRRLRTMKTNSEGSFGGMENEVADEDVTVFWREKSYRHQKDSAPSKKMIYRHRRESAPSFTGSNHRHFSVRRRFSRDIFVIDIGDGLGDQINHRNLNESGNESKNSKSSMSSYINTSNSCNNNKHRNRPAQDSVILQVEVEKPTKVFRRQTSRAHIETPDRDRF